MILPYKDAIKTIIEANRTKIALRGRRKREGQSKWHIGGLCAGRPEESHFNFSTPSLVPLKLGNKLVDEGKNVVEDTDDSW